MDCSLYVILFFFYNIEFYNLDFLFYFMIYAYNQALFFIDRNGTLFEYILEYLRTDCLSLHKLNKKYWTNLYESLLSEAKFFNLESLIVYLEQKIKTNQTINFFFFKFKFSFVYLKKHFDVFRVLRVGLQVVGYFFVLLDFSSDVEYLWKSIVEAIVVLVLWEIVGDHFVNEQVSIG